MLKLFQRSKHKPKMKIPKSIQIQGIAEGGSRGVIIESMMTALSLNTSIPGTFNAFTTYESQVAETYDKYNGFTSFGAQQTRAVVDLRTAFIAGEGLSISCEDEATSKWIENFVTKNRLDGNNFVNAVKGSEMAGQSLLLLSADNWFDGSLYIKVSRVPYVQGQPYRPVYKDTLIREEVIDIQIKRDGIWISFGYPDFIYVRTGGDDVNSSGPVTKIGVILTDLENYDRAIKDMRRNNHIFARITPVFETTTDAEANSLQAKLNEVKWRIGQAFIGKAKMSYQTPKEGAHANLETELAAAIKSISAVTGIPVHWLGYVDLMSNRATATTLYEFIKNATINERVEWQNQAYHMIYKAQELYINNGGTELPRLDSDYQVTLPLIDFGNFLERVRGLSIARADTAISMDDYRNALPGIDPTKTKRAIEQEQKKDQENLMRLGLDIEENETKGEEEEDE